MSSISISQILWHKNCKNSMIERIQMGTTELSNGWLGRWADVVTLCGQRLLRWQQRVTLYKELFMKGFGRYMDKRSVSRQHCLTWFGRAHSFSIVDNELKKQISVFKFVILIMTKRVLNGFVKEKSEWSF